MALIDDLRNGIRDQGNVEFYFPFGTQINTQNPGPLQVFLRQTDIGIEINHVDFQPPGESATVLWLPWRDGEFPRLDPVTMQNVEPETVFLTYNLTGCKVFAVEGGPIWHIQATIEEATFWPEITGNLQWKQGEEKSVAYLHLDQQRPATLWDISKYLENYQADTYGCKNLGQAFVAGIVKKRDDDSRYLELYFGTRSKITDSNSFSWRPLKYNMQKLK